MPRPGQYREILVPGLEKLKEYDMAKAVEKQEIKLAVANSIRGPVQTRRNLTELFADAMEFMREDSPELVKYYKTGLNTGTIVPVVNNCAEINARIADRVYAPGQLFFTS